MMPIRPGFHTLTPYLLVTGVEELMEFLRNAFNAEETFRTTGAAGGMHAEMRIGDSMVMLGDVTGRGEPMPVMVYMYVDDVDTVYERAVALGAKSIAEPETFPDGERRGAIEDPSGNHWWIATPVRRAEP